MDKDTTASVSPTDVPTPLAPPPPGEWPGRVLIATLLVTCVLAFVLVVRGPTVRAGEPKDTGGIDLSSFFTSTADGVALVRFSGVLSFSEEAGVYSLARVSPTDALVRQLQNLRKDKRVKGLVLRINSPGGTLAASQEVANQVRSLARKMPVVVSMADMAASGGYYIAAPATYILVNRGTITGSIGVITSLFNYGELAKRYGLSFPTFKSGKFKDMGSPHRDVTPEEEQLFNKLVIDAWRQFVDTVLDGRVITEVKDKDVEKLVKKARREPRLKSRSDVETLADGRIYTGEDAVTNGLADGIGDLEDAIKKCGILADLGENPRVIKPSPFEELFRGIGSGGLSDMTRSIQLSMRVPILYLYAPGL